MSEAQTSGRSLLTTVQQFVLLSTSVRSTSGIAAARLQGPEAGELKGCSEACKTPNVAEEGQSQEHHDAVDLLRAIVVSIGFSDLVVDLL